MARAFPHSTVMKDKPAAYCRARLAGMTCREAAAAAGYASGPSPKAKRLCKLVETVHAMGDVDRATLERELATVRRRLAEHAARKSQIEEWLGALDVLDRLTRSGSSRR